MTDNQTEKLTKSITFISDRLGRVLDELQIITEEIAELQNDKTP